MKLPPSSGLFRRPLATAWLCLTVGVVFSSGCGGRHQRTQPLTSLSKQDLDMLRQYELIRASLAKDDARGAKRTAANFPRAAAASAAAGAATPVAASVAKIAAANSLEPEREAFRTWSAYVITLTKNVEGFYVIHCPVPGCGDWLQTDPNVDNPYMGKSMHDCGELQK